MARGLGALANQTWKHEASKASIGLYAGESGISIEVLVVGPLPHVVLQCRQHLGSTDPRLPDAELRDQRPSWLIPVGGHLRDPDHRFASRVTGFFLHHPFGNSGKVVLQEENASGRMQSAPLASRSSEYFFRAPSWRDRRSQITLMRSWESKSVFIVPAPFWWGASASSRGNGSPTSREVRRPRTESLSWRSS